MHGRWPLHPAPGDYELLPRWIRRLADAYGVSVAIFSKHALGIPPDQVYKLTNDPTEDVLARLEAGTGIPVERLREMTYAKIWNWLIGEFHFPPPVALHDYRYLGVTFRERERIKRKKQRWTDRLHRLPLLERQALLSAIEEAWRISSPETAMVVDAQRILSSETTIPADLAGNGDADRIAICDEGSIARLRA